MLEIKNKEFIQRELVGQKLHTLKHIHAVDSH